MNTTSNKLPKLIKIKEAADMLSVNPVTLRRWDKAGKLKAVVVSKRGDRRYRLEDIKKFIDDSLR